ncbi:MAG TPA: hypothetical protein VD907_03720 [Verrucomicrobiae bacterium]|nr:hypothetical protein [Verrucomicrobiae bacterium]
MTAAIVAVDGEITYGTAKDSSTVKCDKTMGDWVQKICERLKDNPAREVRVYAPGYESLIRHEANQSGGKFQVFNMIDVMTSQVAYPPKKGEFDGLIWTGSSNGTGFEAYELRPATIGKGPVYRTIQPSTADKLGSVIEQLTTRGCSKLAIFRPSWLGSDKITEAISRKGLTIPVFALDRVEILRALLAL